MQSLVLTIQMASDNEALCFLQAGNGCKRFCELTLLIITSREMKNVHFNILLLFPAFILLTIVFLEKPFIKL